MAKKNKELNIGDSAPEFCLPDKDKNKTCLKDFKSKWVILYFYPKDMTSGCTLEAIDFTEAHKDFDKMNAQILGVSPDTPESHCTFADKKNLTITLLSDTEHKALEQYGVWQKKSMYGKEYWGVVRSTFLIDPNGKIHAVWRNVKVPGHIEEVKETLKELQSK